MNSSLFNLHFKNFQIAHEFSFLTVKNNLMTVPPNQTGSPYYKLGSHQKIKSEEIYVKNNDVMDFLHETLIKRVCRNLQEDRKIIGTRQNSG